MRHWRHIECADVVNPPRMDARRRRTLCALSHSAGSRPAFTDGRTVPAFSLSVWEQPMPISPHAGIIGICAGQKWPASSHKSPMCCGAGAGSGCIKNVITENLCVSRWSVFNHNYSSFLLYFAVVRNRTGMHSMARLPGCTRL